MTTSTATPTTNNLASTPGLFLLPWTSRGLEGLWLLAVFLVPLIFLNQDYVISQAQIAYVEVPKVALLRTLAGAMAVLWLVEWAINSRVFEGSFPSISTDIIIDKLRPTKMAAAFTSWLRVHPSRWVILSAWLFFGSTFLSTILSGSFTTSLWGEIPGQDGYSAYSVASWGILFAVIATRLRTSAQLARVLGAIISMGFLVGLYGNLQHFGHDFLGVTEITGGGSARVTIFMGNTIFAGAVLAMTVPVTLVAAAVTLRREDWGNWGPLSKLRQLDRDSMLIFFWAMILSVQLLGLMFTFSRGPWVGAVLAMAVFMGLVVISLGWRMLIRTGLVLGLAGILSVAFLHWQGSVSIINLGQWLGLALALAGLVGTFAVLFLTEKFGRLIVLFTAVGAAIVILGAAMIGPSALSGRGGTESTNATAGSSSTSTLVTSRITSIKTDVLGGFIGGRGTHWKVSWELIKDRPWFEFDDLKLSWLRPLVGYGPDLFRYTYLLESPPEAASFLPLEPDHAHNFFIHQTVEQGIFGGVASLALFASAFGIAAHHLLRRRKSGDSLYRLLLFGIVAIIIGRFLEMMVGVARISDLTVLWVLFALVAALVRFDDEAREKAQEAALPVAIQSSQSPNRRERRRSRGDSKPRSITTGMAFRLATVAWLVITIGLLTWQQSINYVRGSVAEGQAIRHFQEGDLERALEDLDKAIRLAPGVPNYYNNRANLFLAYQLRPEIIRQPECDRQTEISYSVCLGTQSLESNLESINRQPFNYRARLAAGNSAFNLSMSESAIESYGTAVGMVPSAWGIRNELADSQINAGLYEDALIQLDLSLAITGDASQSTRASYLKGRAFQELGRSDEALRALKLGLSLAYSSESSDASFELINTIYTAQGIHLDIDHFDKEISEDPDDAVAYYFRGLAHFRLGGNESAIDDFNESYELGVQTPKARALRGIANIRTGKIDGPNGEMAQAILSGPSNPLINAYYAEFKLTEGNLIAALNYAENSNALDPDLGLGYLIRGKAFLLLGLEESARQALKLSVGLDFPTSQDYITRGEIFAFLGESEMAFSDINQAIRINPNQASFYHTRGKVYANMGEFDSALADLNTAIEKDSSVGEFFITRGVVYDILGKPDLSIADFEIGKQIASAAIPRPDQRDVAFFAVYPAISSIDNKANLRLKLQIVREAYWEIEKNTLVRPSDNNYPFALQVLAESYLELENWGPAADVLSKMIDVSPSTLEAYRFRGEAYSALKQYAEANADFSQALAIDAFDSAIFILRGNTYAEMEEYTLARGDFNAALRWDPDSSDAFAARGYLSVQSGNHSLALPDINRAIELSPLNHDALVKRGNAYIGLGQAELALSDLDQAIIIAPTNSDYLYSRGLLYLGLTEYESALKDFDAAIDLNLILGNIDPRHAKPFIGRGRANLRLGNPSQALDDANRGRRILEINFQTSVDWAGYRPTIDIQLADAHDVLGDAYKSLGEESLADAHDVLGDAYKSLGEESKAQSEYKIASNLR